MRRNLNFKFNCSITQGFPREAYFLCSYLRVHRALSGNAKSHGDETSSSWCRVAQCHIECSSVFCLSFVEISFEKCYKALRNRSRQREKIPALVARPGSYSWQTLSSKRSNDRARKLSQCLAKHSWARQKNATNDAKKTKKLGKPLTDKSRRTWSQKGSQSNYHRLDQVDTSSPPLTSIFRSFKLFQLKSEVTNWSIKRLTLAQPEESWQERTVSCTRLEWNCILWWLKIFFS